eukprot:TRINITY_DN6977_c0_g1_i1.p1 TRINITY_DN6977_c0_g1~~TRINITY_DN6977_c0_g1_i1.p1  ORF type:complete len:416 (+),score=69.64 TRINITY_DN6977_c0_g1_i1:53-1249(+)
MLHERWKVALVWSAFFLSALLPLAQAVDEPTATDKSFMWAYSNVLPEELLPLLTEESKSFFSYEWSSPLDDESRRTRWVSREQLENPRTTVELAIRMLSEVASPKIPVNWGGCEWWVQVRSSRGSLSFHFDKDEALWDYRKEMVHPLIASVFYLTDHGGPTLITNQTWSDKKPYAFPIQPDSAGYSFPEKNKYLLFNGSLLHAILPSPYQHNEIRVTLLVNYWEKQPSWPNVDVLDYNHVSFGLWGETVREALTRFYRYTIKPKIEPYLLVKSSEKSELRPFSYEAENQIKIWDANAKKGVLIGHPTEIETKWVEMDTVLAEEKSKTLKFSYRDLTFAVELPRRNYMSSGVALLHYGDESKAHSAESSGALKYWINSAKIKSNSLRFSAPIEEDDDEE